MYRLPGRRQVNARHDRLSTRLMPLRLSGGEGALSGYRDKRVLYRASGTGQELEFASQVCRRGQFTVRDTAVKPVDGKRRRDDRADQQALEFYLCHNQLGR